MDTSPENESETERAERCNMEVAEFRKEFSDALRNLRMARRYHLKDVCKNLRMCITTLSRMETGRVVPTMPKMLALANFYGVDLIDFLVSVHNESKPLGAPFYDVVTDSLLFSLGVSPEMAKIPVTSTVKRTPDKIPEFTEDEIASIPAIVSYRRRGHPERQRIGLVLRGRYEQDPSMTIAKLSDWSGLAPSSTRTLMKDVGTEFRDPWDKTGRY